MKKKDFILIGGVLLLALVSWLLFKGAGLFGKSGNQQLTVTVAGEVYGTYPLNENQTIEIGETNICRIQDGQVTMIQADCPDHLCLRQGPIDSKGETIVCLPNRVVLEISAGEAGDREQELDSIVK